MIVTVCVWSRPKFQGRQFGRATQEEAAAAAEVDLMRSGPRWTTNTRWRQALIWFKSHRATAELADQCTRKAGQSGKPAAYTYIYSFYARSVSGVARRPQHFDSACSICCSRHANCIFQYVIHSSQHVKPDGASRRGELGN